MPKISSVVTHALLAYAATTAEGFTPSSLMGSSSSSSSSTSTATPPHSASSSNTALHVSVVSSFLTKEEADHKITNMFETETPESVGMDEVTKSKSKLLLDTKDVTNTATSNNNNNTKSNSSRRSRRRNRRKHNFSANQEFRHEQPDTDFYTLHSSAVSHLQKDMPIQDITRAIKRAQNLHDAHDLGTIAAFLKDECDSEWGYGFRGSLLSRTAVAALHMDQVEIALQAIATRVQQERSSMQPYESAAIVRGLMRVGQVDQAWKVLDDELALLPATTTTTTSDADTEKIRELIQHRSRVLASIASRHFYNGEPHLATRALDALATLGDFLFEHDNILQEQDLHLPWTRLVNAAMDCRYNPEECSVDMPSDLSELVFDAMGAFPCPGGEEECGLDDYLFDE